MLQQYASDSSLASSTTTNGYAAAATSAFWDQFAHKRSRSSSPYTDSFLIDLSYLDLEDPEARSEKSLAKVHHHRNTSQQQSAQSAATRSHRVSKHRNSRSELELSENARRTHLQVCQS